MSHPTCRRPARLLAAVVALAATFAGGAPAAHAEVGTLTVQGAYAGPITAASGCIADERASWNANTAFNPAQPVKVQGGNPLNIPSVEDLVPARIAGAHSDYCLAFRLTTNLDPRHGRATVPVQPGDPARPTFLTAANTVPVGDFPDTAAGTGDDLNRAVVDMPLGYLGNPAGVPRCTDAQFFLASGNPPTCPPGSQVGNTMFNGFVNLYEDGTDQSGFQLRAGAALGASPLALSRGAIYNLTPSPDELGRLGVSIQPTPTVGAAKFIVRLLLTDGPNPRVRTITENIPTQITAGDANPDGTPLPNPPTGDTWPNARISLESIGLQLWGSKLDHPTMGGDHFSENATACDADQAANVAVETVYGTLSHLTTAPHRLSDCSALAFTPSVSVTTTEHRPGVPTATTVRVGLGQSSGARTTALLKDARVTLPAGLELGAQVGSHGLPLCTAAQFDGEHPLVPSSCPAPTTAAAVTIATPLVDVPFVGSAYLGEQPAVGELPALYVEAKLAGSSGPTAPRIKLVGEVSVGADGQLTTAFLNNPQLRFSELKLEFPGGPNALFSTPRVCGVHSGTSSFQSYAGTAPVTDAASITIDEDCATVPFAPSVAITATNPQAGASSPTQITIERADRSAWLDDLKVSLPSGFLADLKLPTECAAALAAAGNCPESARIATVRTLAGTGADPLPLEGAMYLTEREPGAVAGAVIVVRAKIGDLDLGDVVVPGTLKLRPTDAGIDFASALPTRFRGIALNLRRVVVDIDRPGFALNPSACGPIAFSAAATGAAGEQASPSGTATYTGCAALPFQPRIRATLTGEVKPLGHPGMFVEVTARPGDSNLRRATVLLPEGVAADLKNVQVTCTRAQFDTVACPAATKVGTAVARVSITHEAIPGDIYLVHVPGEALPGLGLSFTGRFAQRVMSVVKINPQGRLITRFDAIPDLPLRTLTIDVAGGAKGPLQLGPDDCANGTRWDATFTGQGDQVATDQTGLRCAAKSAVRLSDRGGLSLRNFDFGGRNLTSAKVTLPAGWSLNAKRAAHGTTSWVRLTGGSARPKFSKSSVSLAVKGTRASTLRLKVGGGAIVRTSRSKQTKTVTVKVRFAFTDGAVQTQAIKLKAR